MQSQTQTAFNFKPLPTVQELFPRARKRSQTQRLYEHLLVGAVTNVQMRDDWDMRFLCHTKRIDELRELLEPKGWTVSEPYPLGNGVNQYQLEKYLYPAADGAGNARPCDGYLNM